MRLGSERIGSETIDVEVDVNGVFMATFDGQDYDATTRLELIEKLTKAVKRSALRGVVDVTVLNLVPNKNRSGWDNGPYALGSGVIDATLRSKHDRQHNTYLLTSCDGKKFQVSGAREGTIARRLTAKEQIEYLKLCQERDSAVAAVEAFAAAVRIDPDKALTGARKKTD
jgi:hypothetical protein